MFDELYKVLKTTACLSYPNLMPILLDENSSLKKSFEMIHRDRFIKRPKSVFNSTSLTNVSLEDSGIDSSNIFRFELTENPISQQFIIRFSIKFQENPFSTIEEVAKLINNSIKIGQFVIENEDLAYLEFFYSSSFTNKTISAFLETLNKMQKIFKRYYLEFLQPSLNSELPKEIFMSMKNLSRVKLFQKYSVIRYKNHKECESDLTIIQALLSINELNEFFFRYEVLFSGMRKLKFLIGKEAVKLHKMRLDFFDVKLQVHELLRKLGKANIRIVDIDFLLSMLYLCNGELLIVPNIPLYKVFEITKTPQYSQAIFEDDDYEPDILKIDSILEAQLKKSNFVSIIEIDLHLSLNDLHKNPNLSTVKLTRPKHIEKFYYFKQLSHKNLVRVYGFFQSDSNKLYAVTEAFKYNSLINALDLSDKPIELLKAIGELIQLISYIESVKIELPLFINCFCIDYSRGIAKVIPYHRPIKDLIPYLTYEEILSLVNSKFKASSVYKRISNLLKLSEYDFENLQELIKISGNVTTKIEDIRGETSEIYRLGLLINEVISVRHVFKRKKTDERESKIRADNTVEMELKIRAQKLLIERRAPVVQSEMNQNSIIVRLIHEMCSVFPKHRISIAALEKLLALNR